MQPRKSKAFIITFIIILALLIAGYFLITKGGILKGDSTLGKKFAPLLGTPKEKDVVINEPTDTTDEPTTPNDQTPPPTNTPPTTPGGSSAQKTQPYVPPTTSFPQPNRANYLPADYEVTTQCDDGKDNDKDGSTDSLDNDCHSDGNATNSRSYVPTYNSETGSKNTPGNVAPQNPATKKAISCDIEEIPLVFTAEEQARLDELTRQFYRLAPQLKSENDILTEISAAQGYEDIIENAENLTKQCRIQTSTQKYLQNAIDTEIIGHSDVVDGPDYRLQNVDFINQSTLNKGRTERLRNPYYDSSKEIYPWKESASYFEVYYLNTWATGSNFEKVWSWQKWEKDREVW